MLIVWYGIVNGMVCYVMVWYCMVYGMVYANGIYGNGMVNGKW